MGIYQAVVFRFRYSSFHGVFWTPGLKELGARAGFSLVTAVFTAYLHHRLTGVLMAVIPTQAVMVLYLCGIFQMDSTSFRSIDKKYYQVIFSCH